MITRRGLISGAAAMAAYAALPKEPAADLNLTQLSGFGVLRAASYQTGAVNFDGTNDYMDRNGDLTSNADSQLVLLSFWVKGAAASNRVWNSTDGNLAINNVITTGKVAINFTKTVGGNAILINPSNTTVFDDTWHHVALWANTGTPVCQLYIDGVLDTATTNVASSTIDFTYANHTFAAKANATLGDNKFNGDFADFYFTWGETLDLSVAGNLAKFRTSGNKPVDLGATGTNPTGTQPRVYFHHDPDAAASDFGTNLGSGGGFTITGALAEATTSPSD